MKINLALATHPRKIKLKYISTKIQFWSVSNSIWVLIHAFGPWFKFLSKTFANGKCNIFLLAQTFQTEVSSKAKSNPIFLPYYNDILAKTFMYTSLANYCKNFLLKPRTQHFWFNVTKKKLYIEHLFCLNRR